MRLNGAAEERRFAALVAGRRIAIVGPARTLEGRGQGSFIDRFDLVVRFNDTFWTLGKESPRASDFGTRADVVYCNQVILRSQVLDGRERRRQFLSRCAELGIKYVVCTNNSLSYDLDGKPAATCPAADRTVVADVGRLLGDAGLETRCRVAVAPASVLHRWLGGQFARTGFVGLFDLLTLAPSDVHVTGMTFYHGGGHLLADVTQVLHPLKNRDGSWARSPSGIGHDSYLEREIMWWLARAFRATVTLDEDLLKILGYTTAPNPCPAESHTSSASNTAERS